MFFPLPALLSTSTTTNNILAALLFATAASSEPSPKTVENQTKAVPSRSARPKASLSRRLNSPGARKPCFICTSSHHISANYWLLLMFICIAALFHVHFQFTQRQRKSQRALCSEQKTPTQLPLLRLWLLSPPKQKLTSAEQIQNNNSNHV